MTTSRMDPNASAASAAANLGAPAPVQSADRFGELDAAAARAEAGREVHTYEVPEPLASRTGVRTVGLVELWTEEELRAAARAGTQAVRLGVELARESLRFVNGRRIHTGDLSADAFWASKQPGMAQVRQLVLAAHQEISNPSLGEVAGFLKSRKVTTG